MADDEPVSVAHDLNHYLRPIRRNLRLVAAITVLGLILGIAAALTLRPTYTASTKVNITADILDENAALTNGRTTGTVNTDTEAQNLKSTEVATIAQQILKTTTSPGALEKRVSVTVPANTPILKISFAAHSPTAAAAGATAFAQAYLQNRQKLATSYVSSQKTQTQAEIRAQRAKVVADSRVYASAKQGSNARHQAASQRGQDQTVLNGYVEQYRELSTDPVFPGTIGSAAAVGGSSPNQLREIAVLTGLILGGLAGLIAAPLREHYDKTVRHEDDLGREDLELIAEIPPMPSGRKAKTRAAKAADATARIRAEQRLASVIGEALGADGGSIYLAELSERVGSQGFAERLALELGRFGSTTEIVTFGATPAAVVDRTVAADTEVLGLDAPRVDRALLPAPTDEVTATPDAAVGWPSQGQPITADPPSPSPSTEIVTVGSASIPNHVVTPAEPSAPPIDATSAILHEVQAALARSRYVILHGTNATVDSEAYILGQLSQATALIIDAGVTSRDELADVVDQVEVTPSELLGAMMWRPKPGDRSANGSRVPKLPSVSLPTRAPREPKPAKEPKPARAPRPAKPPKAAKPPKPAKPARAPKPVKPPKAAKPTKPAKPAKPAKAVQPPKPATPKTTTPAKSVVGRVDTTTLPNNSKSSKPSRFGRGAKPTSSPTPTPTGVKTVTTKAEPGRDRGTSH